MLPKFLAAVFLIFLSWPTFAGTFVSTIKGGVAINGFDTVAFFTAKKAVAGRPEHSFEWMGATWLFSSPENLDLFKADPHKYAPQYGGNCALGVSQGYISRKPTNGTFEIYGGKLYLFPEGSRSPDGAVRDWIRWGVSRSIADGDANWPKLKTDLESRSRK